MAGIGIVASQNQAGKTPVSYQTPASVQAVAATSNSGVALAFTLAAPTAGNLLVAVIGNRGVADIPGYTAPAGFTLAHTIFMGSSVYLYAYTKVATGAETSLTWTPAGTGLNAGVVREISGATATLDAYSDRTTDQTVGSMGTANTLAIPALTAPAPAALIGGIGLNAGSGTPGVTFASETLSVPNTTNRSAQGGFAAVTAGSHGTTATWTTTATRAVGYLLAFRAATT